MYNDDGGNNEILSKVVRAGRRTYFFDVRETRAGDYYMTITESKKTTLEDGTSSFKKHKIYLYKEDFHNFSDAFNEVSKFILSKKGEEIISNDGDNQRKGTTDISFEDI